ncbi:MAG: DNA-3-methyladenine glycosylase family protein, partial [Acidimicrobiia bacterium]
VRLGGTGDVHGAMVKAVLGQVVTTKEAKRSLASLRRTHGHVAPGPRSELRTVPSPARLASMSYEEFHSHGVERSRASILIEVSRRAHRLAEALEMGRAEAYSRLQAIRGVGVWTASLVMGAAWGDKDAVPIGDYHMPNSVAWTLAGEDRGTDERMIELLEPFRPERRRIVLAIKQSGLHAPRYGPRTATRTHL